MSCDICGSKSVIRDDTTGNLYCDSCGAEQVYDNFQAQTFDVTSGPQGTTIRVGSSGTGSYFNYKEKKIFEANKLIDDLTFQLKLTAATTLEIKTLIKEVTDGEFGLGEWFHVLIGACIYIVMRRDRKSLSIAEIAAVVGCEDVNELGRMIARVVEFRDLKLPEFDIVGFFERTLSNSLRGELDRSRFERVRKQGVFLMNCAVKWFLTTGRRPGAVVVAVIVFVAEVNGVVVVGCGIEDLAKEVHAAVKTCRLRYKEICERLVEVAQALPWGKDVNVKNIVRNAPFVIRYMEMKSMEEEEEEEKGSEVENENVGFDLGEAVKECLRKEVEYGEEIDSVESDARYFEVGFERLVGDGVDKLKISHECLAMIYTDFANEVDCNKYLGEKEEFRGRKRRRGFELRKCTEWWNGKSELSKKLLLKKILEKDVGLNPMPPSFVKGCAAKQRRREKIKAAKHRIDKIMNPSNTGSGDCGDTCISELVDNGKKRRRRKRRVHDIDWEDFIIETLLLHQVKEEEIEKGHYNTLLDLHVFNSGVM